MVTITMDEKACMAALAAMHTVMELAPKAHTDLGAKTKDAVKSILIALKNQDHEMLAYAIAKDFQPIWGDIDE